VGEEREIRRFDVQPGERADGDGTEPLRPTAKKIGQIGSSVAKTAFVHSLS
jgi:hypothetical protein